ncbi:14-3-3 protein beta/theta/zeta [Enteropsectra breve]|nr:14-3-3 protein beta/theta/zeta [Enteropsectra breve]
MSSENCQELMKKAHYCDIAERYRDMANEMKKVIEICNEEKHEISISVRNLFSLAYKNLVSTRRSSWRVLCSEKQKIEDRNSSDVVVIDELLSKVEEELLVLCDEVLEIITKYLLDSIEDRTLAHNVFFLKMKGDYYRYKAEIISGSEEKKIADMALECYTEAKKQADGLKPTDPNRLGLYLNFSVFNYEILNDIESACTLARSAFNTAISELDNLSEDYYKDSTLIMQLLRDNLSLWSTRNDTNFVKSGENEKNPDN